jgi:pilus assembly protein CpaE
MSLAQSHDPFADFDDDFGVSNTSQNQYDEDDFDLDLKDPYLNGRPEANYSTDGLDSLDPFGMDKPSPKKAKPQRSIPQPQPAPRQPAQRQRPVEPSNFQSPPEAVEDVDGESVSIPRIAIHFFAETKATGMSCEAVSRDRRLNRAQCAVRPGGIAGAVAAYQDAPTPQLIIVETTKQGGHILKELEALAEVCSPETKVVVIGQHNDIRLYRELTKNGISDYAVAPLKPLEIIKIIGNIYNDPDTPFVGRTLAFIGARGGTGASTLSHNIGYMLSEQLQANTIIVDYDMSFGTSGLDFNQDPMQGMADALMEPDRLDPVLLDRMLTKCTDKLSLFSAPATLDIEFVEDAEAYEEVTSKVRAVAPFIIMDLPHLWSAWMKRCLINADDVIIVATPDLASLRNTKNIIDLLKSHRPNDKPPRIVLNQADVPGRPEIPVKDFTAALGVAPIVVIPFDPKNFGQASNNGQMLVEVAPEAKASVALQQLVSSITGRAPEVKPKKSMLSNLFKK